MIFMGSRIDLDIQSLMLPEPTHGEHSSLLGLQPFKTVGEAFAGLPSLNYCPRIF